MALYLIAFEVHRFPHRALSAGTQPEALS